MISVETPTNLSLGAKLMIEMMLLREILYISSKQTGRQQ